MELQAANALIEQLEEAGYEARLYEGYSGRCMYGKTTYGVTTDCNPGSMEYHEIDYPRMDSMGMDFIYY